MDKPLSWNDYLTGMRIERHRYREPEDPQLHEGVSYQVDQASIPVAALKAEGRYFEITVEDVPGWKVIGLLPKEEHGNFPEHEKQKYDFSPLGDIKPVDFNELNIVVNRLNPDTALWAFSSDVNIGKMNEFVLVSPEGDAMVFKRKDMFFQPYVEDGSVPEALMQLRAQIKFKSDLRAGVPADGTLIAHDVLLAATGAVMHTDHGLRHQIFDLVSTYAPGILSNPFCRNLLVNNVDMVEIGPGAFALPVGLAAKSWTGVEQEPFIVEYYKGKGMKCVMKDEVPESFIPNSEDGSRTFITGSFVLNVFDGKADEWKNLAELINQKPGTVAVFNHHALSDDRRLFIAEQVAAAGLRLDIVDYAHNTRDGSGTQMHSSAYLVITQPDDEAVAELITAAIQNHKEVHDLRLGDKAKLDALKSRYAVLVSQGAVMPKVAPVALSF